MTSIKFSVVIFYDHSGKLLIQDRRNLGKDAIEWGWFGGGAEGNESPVDTALREIREEINIQLQPSDMTYIGKTIIERVFEDITREGSVFITQWKEEYNKDFLVLEGAGSEWVTPEEMKTRSLYATQRVHLSMFEDYLHTIHA